MNPVSQAGPIFRIELWHGFFLLFLLSLLVPLGILEPWALMAGGVFMGVNFLLLGLGIRFILTPLASRARVRSGIILLTLKLVLFLGLISMIFLRFEIDGLSFIAGISSLLAAIVVERLLAALREGE